MIMIIIEEERGIPRSKRGNAKNPIMMIIEEERGNPRSKRGNAKNPKRDEGARLLVRPQKPERARHLNPNVYARVGALGGWRVVLII